MQATPATWHLLLENGWQGSPHLKALCGGEALPNSLAEKLQPRVGILWNMYGPTETTIWSSLAHVTDATETIFIGRPIANTQMYVLDSQLNPVPAGAPGTLYISGEGVAKGYLNRPKETQKAFTANPFLADTQKPLYNTGDRVRYSPQRKQLQYLGREDAQIKLRGFRIETGEIEHALVQHPDIRDAFVVMRERTEGKGTHNQYLCTYYEATQPLEEPKLRQLLSASLPTYMIPSRFVHLDKIPLSPSGKKDKNALPEPEQLAPLSTANTPAPQTKLQKTIIGVWREILGFAVIGPEQNFLIWGPAQWKLCKQPIC